MVLSRKNRRDNLVRLLSQDPFLADRQLAKEFAVSVATIRLDRMALDIPEVRERTKDMANKTYAKLKSIQGSEVIGELVDIEVGSHAISLLSVTEEMVFARNQIMRGHYLFAQGNSLAVALINSSMALTAKAQVRYFRPVKNEDRVIAKATLVSQEGHRYTIKVESRVLQELVFTGEFVVVAIDHKKEGDTYENRG